MHGELNSGPDACVSDLGMDAYLADELSLGERAALVSHLERCERCKARLAELERLSQAYHQGARSQVLEAALGAYARKKQKKSRAWQGFSALALAALGVLAVLPRGAFSPDQGARAKGESRIGFYVKHGAQVRKGSDGERVQPGDQLRFTYTVSRKSYLTVMGIDQKKQVSLYFAAWVAVGQNKALPSAVELDGTLGFEHIYALFCTHELPAEPLQHKLEQSPESLRAEPGCELQALRLLKVEK